MVGQGTTFAPGKTGGSKFLASHSHSVAAFSTNSGGAHSHNGRHVEDNKVDGSSTRMGHNANYESTYSSGAVSGKGSHTHPSVSTTTNTTGTGITVSSTAYSNMPPYLVVYMWQRTA